MANATIDQFNILYRPQMNFICKIVEYFVFGITLLFLSFASYTIYKKSSEAMHLYKYLLLSQLFWGLLFDTLLVLWQPVPIFYGEKLGDGAFAMAYSNGVFKYFLNLKPDLIFTLFAILFLIIIGMVHSLVFAMIFRVLAVFPNSRLNELINNPNVIWKIFFGTLGLAILLLEWPMFFLIFYPKDLDGLYKHAIEILPPMKEIMKKEPSTSGCHLNYCYLATVLFLPTYTIAILGILIAGLVIGILYFRQVVHLNSQKSMTSGTKNLNRMLMRAQLAHGGVIDVFLLFPAISLYVIVYLGNEETNIVNEVFIILFGSHSIFDAILMLWFIKPYRIFAIKCSNRILQKLKIRSGNKVMGVFERQSALQSSRVTTQISFKNLN